MIARRSAVSCLSLVLVLTFAVTALAGAPADRMADPQSPGPAPATPSAPGPWTLLERLRSRPLSAPRSAPPGESSRIERAAAASSDADPQWLPLGAVPRRNHAAVYDPVRGRVIITMGRLLDYEAVDPFFFDAQALGLGVEPAWVPLSSSDQFWGRGDALAIYDGINDRLLVHGGWHVHWHAGLGTLGDLVELPLEPGGRWRPLTPSGPAPPARCDHAGIFDPVRKRMLLFGGRHEWSVKNQHYQVPYSDLWELSLEGAAAWREISLSGEIPTPGVGGTALYDAARDRMLFVAKDSVWTMTLDPTGTWTRLVASGAGPAAAKCAVLDAGRDRLLVQVGPRTWEFALGSSTWSEIIPEGTRPTAADGYTVTWDPVGDRLVLHGGGDEGSDETWFLTFRDGPRWEDQSQLRNPVLVGHKTVYDPLRDRLIAIGGDGNPGVLEMPLDRPGAVWTPLATLGPGPPAGRVGHGAVYDPRRDRILMQDGVSTSGVLTPPATTWQLTLGGTPTWSRLAARPAPGQPCDFFSLVLDAPRDRLILFGGSGEAPRFESSNGVWQLGLSDPSADWERLEPAGDPPSPRIAHDAVYDPVREIMLVHGGYNYELAGYDGLSDDWILSLRGTPSWTCLGDSQIRRCGHSLIYDPVRDQYIMTFGEPDWYSDQGAGLRKPGGWDGWWESYGFFDSPGPPRRQFHGAAYDPLRDRVIVSGGAILLRDVWALTFGTPQRDVAIDVRPDDAGNSVNLGANGVLPVAILSEARFDATTVDPLSVRLAGAGVRVRPNGLPQVQVRDVNADGRNDLVLHIETEALRLAPTDTLALLTGLAPGNLTVRGRDRIRIVGTVAGRNPGATLLTAERITAPALTAVRALPGGRVAVSLALPVGGTATLDLIDVTGRRLARAALLGSGAAQEQVLGEGTLPAGVYWVRLTHAGQALTRKTVVLR